MSRFGTFASPSACVVLEHSAPEEVAEYDIIRARDDLKQCMEFCIAAAEVRGFSATLRINDHAYLASMMYLAGIQSGSAPPKTPHHNLLVLMQLHEMIKKASVQRAVELTATTGVLHMPSGDAVDRVVERMLRDRARTR